MPIVYHIHMAFDIKKLSSREKNIVGALILVLSTIPFFQFTLPAWNEYNQLNDSLNSDKGKISSIDIQIKKLEKLKGKNLDLSKKVEDQKLFLAKSHEIDFLVQDLKRLCDESSVSLESFTPANSQPINIVLEKQVDLDAIPQTKGKNDNRAQRAKQALEKLKGQELPIDLYSLPIEVKVTGSFRDFVDLFKKLEKYGRVISVDNISIGKVQSKRSGGDRLSKAKKEDKTDLDKLFGSFDLIAYSLPAETETISIKDLQKSKTTSKSFRFKR